MNAAKGFSGVLASREQWNSWIKERTGNKYKVLLETRYEVFALSKHCVGLDEFSTTSKYACIWGRAIEDERPVSLGNVEIVDQLAESPNRFSGSYIYLRASDEESALQLVICNDQFGLRPIYYCEKDGAVFFSSSAREIVRVAGIERIISDESLLHFYCFGVSGRSRFVLDGVSKLESGSRCFISARRAEAQRYFHLSSLYAPSRFTNVPEEEICRQLDCALSRSLQSRLNEGEAAGISISGGVDSGYLAQKLIELGADVHGFNLSYKSSYNEHSRVQRISELLGLKVSHIEAGTEDIIAAFESCNALSSEPMGLNSTVMSLVAKDVCATEIALCFDGDAADRIFLGMNRYVQYLRLLRVYRMTSVFHLTGLFARVFRSLESAEFKKASLLFGNWDRGIHPYPERVMHSVSDAGNRAFERRVFDSFVKEISEEYQQGFGPFDFGLYFTFHALKMSSERFFHPMLEANLMHNVESAPGYVCKELVSIALSLPLSLKIRRSSTKYILRQAATRAIKSEYWSLPKIGLQNPRNYLHSVPIGREWLREKCSEVLASDEYARLQDLVPESVIDAESLVPLVSWKSQA